MRTPRAGDRSNGATSATAAGRAPPSRPGARRRRSISPGRSRSGARPPTRRGRGARREYRRGRRPVGAGGCRRRRASSTAWPCPGPRSGATVGGANCEGAGNRCVNPVAVLGWAPDRGRGRRIGAARKRGAQRAGCRPQPHFACRSAGCAARRGLPHSGRAGKVREADAWTGPGNSGQGRPAAGDAAPGGRGPEDARAHDRRPGGIRP